MGRARGLEDGGPGPPAGSRRVRPRPSAASPCPGVFQFPPGSHELPVPQAQPPQQAALLPALRPASLHNTWFLGDRGPRWGTGPSHRNELRGWMRGLT